MMMKAFYLLLSARSLTDAAPLLRRTRQVDVSEFVRGIDPKQEVDERALREEANHVHVMLMSNDHNGAPVSLLPTQGMSMEDGCMSMGPTLYPCPGDGMSMPLDGETAFPVDDGMSYPYDQGMSYPYDEGMSYLYDEGMSYPHDEGMMGVPLNDSAMSMPCDAAMSYDVTMSYAIDSDIDNDVCDDESNPVVTVSQSFEVDTSLDTNPVGILSDALVAAIEGAGFLLCPETTLAPHGQLLEETVILGVKVDSVVDDGETCSLDTSDCEVATATFGVIHADGSSSEEAKYEFLGRLEHQLGDGVQVRMFTSPTDSQSIPISSIETDSSSEGKSDSKSKKTVKSIETGSDGGLPAPTVAMATVLSVAAAAVALVLLQRKFTNKRDDDTSVDGSMMTSPTTVQDTSILA